MRRLLPLLTAGCTPALITSYAGLRTEALPLQRGDPAEVAVTVAGDFRQGVEAYDADGWASVGVRLPVAGVTTVELVAGGGFPELGHLRANLLSSWPRDPGARVHGGTRFGLGVAAVGQPLGVYEVHAVATASAGAHLHVRANHTLRWVFSADVQAVPTWYRGSRSS